MPLQLKQFEIAHLHNARFIGIDGMGAMHMECVVGEEEKLFVHIENHIRAWRQQREFEAQYRAKQAPPIPFNAPAPPPAFVNVSPQGDVNTANQDFVMIGKIKCLPPKPGDTMLAVLDPQPGEPIYLPLQTDATHGNNVIQGVSYGDKLPEGVSEAPLNQLHLSIPDSGELAGMGGQLFPRNNSIVSPVIPYIDTKP